MAEPILEESTVLSAASGVYARAFGEELVLLQFATGEYFGLDAVGAMIWHGIEAGDSLGRIAERIAETWEIDRFQAFRDMVILLRAMCAESLVRAG